MLDKMTNRLDFHGNALILRAERQRAIASNIANADTPGYVARDFKFSDALSNATGERSSYTESPHQLSTTTLGNSGYTSQRPTVTIGTDPRHITASTADEGSSAELGNKGKLAYSLQTQPALDNNSVDLDRERAAFVDNAVRYEATLRFINGNAKTMLSAIQGQ
ncbi:flagellar basal body rod protein FlgB [Acidovorax sp.]|jgi:flagellar basal-body rod protein FlgB|uniref:flagellar basal body rod protein FlgB n=1 Tax=Acidovorax sp. TaxID=1872122 RepID=UPI00391F8963